MTFYRVLASIPIPRAIGLRVERHARPRPRLCLRVFWLLGDYSHGIPSLCLCWREAP